MNEDKITCDANYTQTDRKTRKDTENVRTETFNYRDGVMGTGWSA